MIFTEFFLKNLSMSITASYCVLFICIVRLFLRRAPKIFSYLLWSIVAVRLLCPISFESSFSLVGQGLNALTDRIETGKEILGAAQPPLPSVNQGMDNYSENAFPTDITTFGNNEASDDSANNFNADSSEANGSNMDLSKSYNSDAYGSNANLSNAYNNDAYGSNASTSNAYNSSAYGSNASIPNYYGSGAHNSNTGIPNSYDSGAHSGNTGISDAYNSSAGGY